MRLALLTAFWLALTACAPAIKVATDWNPATTPTMVAWKTYSWLPLPKGGDSRIYNDLFNARMHETVDAYLAGRGYVKVEDGQPADFEIAWQASIDQKLSLTTVNTYYGYGYYGWYDYGPSAMGPSGGWGTDTYVEQYDEGTIIIDLVDGPTDQLMWRGIARSELMNYRDPDKRQARLEKAIADLFEEFPPYGGAPSGGQ